MRRKKNCTSGAHFFFFWLNLWNKYMLLAGSTRCSQELDCAGVGLFNGWQWVGLTVNTLYTPYDNGAGWAIWAIWRKQCRPLIFGRGLRGKYFRKTLPEWARFPRSGSSRLPWQNGWVRRDVSVSHPIKRAYRPAWASINAPAGTWCTAVSTEDGRKNVRSVKVNTQVQWHDVCLRGRLIDHFTCPLNDILRCEDDYLLTAVKKQNSNFLYIYFLMIHRHILHSNRRIEHSLPIVI